MQRCSLVLLLNLTLAISASAATTQHPPAGAATKDSNKQESNAKVASNGLIGEVTAIDQSGKQIIARTDSGEMFTAMLDDNTVYLRVSPDEKGLEKAARIALADIAAGDRIYARGRVSDDKKSVAARQLIVMNRVDIEKKREQERAEWKRGVAGVITSLDASSKEITLQLAGQGDGKSIIVAAGEEVRFRRYAPDSVKFSDAQQSSFAELKVGDQLRATGQKSPDGSRFTAAQIVSGSFKTVGGTVSGVNLEAGEIKINMLGSNKPLTIVVNKESTVRRITPQLAAIISQRAQPRPPGAGATAQPASPSPASQESDIQEMIERLPALPLTEVKQGDVIAVSGTAGADASRLTAITFITGMEAVLNALQRQRGPQRQIDLNTGLPPGVLLGIGQP